MPGAFVTVVSQTDTQVGASAITDGDGRYQVAGVTVGPVSVSAAKGTGVGRAAGGPSQIAGQRTHIGSLAALGLEHGLAIIPMFYKG